MAAPTLNPTIFVMLPSYRDPECHKTITDLFEKALRPECVFVGVVWQYDAVVDADYLRVPYPRMEQVRVKHFALEECNGAGWARNEALTLWNGEHYILQIQAHSRFEYGWDVTLMEMLSRCPSVRPVLALWPPNYTPFKENMGASGPHTPRYRASQSLGDSKEDSDQINRYVQRTRINAMGGKQDAQFVHLTSDYMKENDPRAGLYPTPWWIGCFMFARAEVFQHLKADPHIFFWGEEIAYSARLYTHGYDLFQNDAPVVYHQWFRKETQEKQGYRAMKDARNVRTLHRVRHLLGLATSDDAEVTQDIEQYGLGNARPLSDFFRFAGIDASRWEATADAKRGYFYPLSHAHALLFAQDETHTMRNAHSTESKARMSEENITQRPRIFVAIAAYRDPECQHTVKEMFEAATHPERVFAGIVWQYARGEDAHCFQVPPPRPAQVRVKDIPASESKGVCWARALGQELWEGEEYVLQIDSHMRFEPGWDETLIAMHGSCESPKAVLSTYPAGYVPPREIKHKHAYKLAAKQFDKDGIFTMLSRPIAREPAPEKPVLGAFAGACMLFGPAEWMRDVPYDARLYFFGEEITLSARLWTHGWDIYHPQVPVMYHYWDRKTRRTHFDDHKEWPKLNKLSFARVRHILGTEISTEPVVLEEIERYGLGAARSLQEYQAFCGVDFAKRHIRKAAYDGNYPAHLVPDEPSPPKPAAPTVKKAGGHAPRKIFESADCVVFDDFLPQELYNKIHEHAAQMDYQYINTQGKVKRVWDISNGFPLRSEKNVFYYADGVEKPDAAWVYPSKTPLDAFVERINGMLSHVKHIVGEPVKAWKHFSVTSWIYPQNTGLSLHDDGSNVYTGAYVFFMNNEWRPHWGGLLILLDHKASQAIQQQKKTGNAYQYHLKKWLHMSSHDDIAMDVGLGQCIFPKANRMVFIHPEAFHFVTQVNPSAGDHHRMSLAGFFHRGKKEGEKKGDQEAKKPEIGY